MSRSKRKPYGSQSGGGRSRRMARPAWLPTALRMTVHAVTAAAVAWPLTHGGAAAAAAVGACVGAVAGPMAAATRARGSVLALGVMAGLIATVLLRHAFVDTGWLAAWIGPAAALRFGDALLFGGAALFVSSGLRLASARRPALAVLEVVAVGLAFAQLVVAHRHGAINRPFVLADPIIAAGGDPTVVFLGIGAVATVVLVLLLLSERRLLRSMLHLTVIVAVLLAVVGATRTFGLPSPPRDAAGLGLRGDGKQKERETQRGSEGEQRKRRKRRQNEQLEFRNNYDQSGSQAPVGVVVLRDDYSPPAGVYYFRQTAFSQYNGRRLVAATREDVDRDIAAGFPTSPIRLETPASFEQGRNEVEQTIALLADHTRPFALEAPVRLAPAQNPDPGRFKRTYRAVSAVLSTRYGSLLGTKAGGAGWSDAQWNHYTEAPEDPRYRELAQRIVDQKLSESQREDSAARAFAVSKWLSERGTYSLKSGHADAEDPTAHFLFGDKTGYCVHFAHAATYLMRVLDVPARVATGYAIDESARRGGSSLLLSGRNSHAWPEIRLEGYGWVPVDISPERVLTPPPEPPDADLQRLLGELARGNSPMPPDAAPQLPRLAAAARGFVADAGRALGLALALALLALFGVKIWRRTVPSFASQHAMPRVVYRAELDRLSEAGWRRRPGESREAFAMRLRDVVPAWEPLTHAHVGAAFGSRRTYDEAARVRAVAKEVHSQLRRQVPWWKRVMGWLTPWSWLRAR